ncbi:hypothetical protein [Flavobacterium sp.]|uniref:hypothetical protein n=1 Tax=Flavobacterium sp. TaxID=239 RepID=UPI00262DF608|nr:hypothetical protein [Flavobacterium sp.]
MDNQDNLFNKIKSAAENAEQQDFPSMEKVWSRIDAKLDTKVEKKHNNNWKIVMIAASVALVVTVGYQFFKTEKEIVSPINEIVIKEAEKPLIQDSLENQNGIVSTEIESPKIKENASEILKEQISKPAAVASQELDMDAENNDDKLMKNKITEASKQKSSAASSSWFGSPKFDSRGVTYDEVKSLEFDSVAIKDKKTKKEEPLLILNGEVSKEKLSNLDEEEIDFILELPEPLYIINKIYYTEQELFGPNPTSPYAPLNKQKIETVVILQPEKAVPIYGEKGKKGVVIITTKDGKPVLKKK